MLPMSDQYNQLSGRQGALWATIRDSFSETLKDLEGDPNRAVQVCEFGCSTGGNSLDPLTLVVRRCQALKVPLLCVLLNDLPSSDWRTTFSVVTPSALLASREKEEDEVPLSPSRILIHGAPRSFYDQVAACGCVDLAFSFTSVHWLSRWVAPITGGGIHPFQETDLEQRAKWMAQAKADWAQFLRMRSRELKPGGLLVIGNLGCADERKFMPSMVNVSIARALKDMVAEGIIEASEAAEWAVPTYYRTVAEIEAPFSDPQLGLELCRLELVTSACPYWAAVEAGTMTLPQYVEELWNFCLGYSAKLLNQALRQRPTEDVQHITAALQHRVQAAITADPAGHRLDYDIIYLVARKHSTAPVKKR